MGSVAAFVQSQHSVITISAYTGNEPKDPKMTTGEDLTHGKGRVEDGPLFLDIISPIVNRLSEAPALPWASMGS